MVPNTHKITVGSDVELFVYDGFQHIPAYDLIPGTKARPFPVPDGMVQVDGMAVEFGIDPSSTRQQFSSKLASVRRTLTGMLHQHGNKITPVVLPTCLFDKKVFDAAPLAAKELGCEPDFNAYTDGEKNPRPEPGDAPVRTAGGHVHIGWTSDVDPFHPNHMQACCMLTKMLDIHLGLPSVFWDSDEKRRTLYGKAGAFRPKPYGMEYRTLSNAWLKAPALVEFVFDQTMVAFNRLMDGSVDYLNIAESVQNTINSNALSYKDKRLRAYQFLTSLKVQLPKPPQKKNISKKTERAA